MRRALAVACFGVALPAAAPAQQPAEPSTPPAAQAKPAPSPLEPQGYTYNPQGRRDPFVSLVRRGSDAPGTTPAIRPAGLAGLTASEVSLRGTIEGRDGMVGLLQGTDNRTYLVRPGDRLLDGTIQSITADTLVITQRVDDPLTGVSAREVRKVIRQTDEIPQ